MEIVHRLGRDWFCCRYFVVIVWGMIIPAAILILLAGAAEGVMDHLQFHYDGSHPFWLPSISWKNKYRNRNPANGVSFRGSFLVFTTDGWHLMKWIRNLTLFASLFFICPVIWWMPAAAWTINRIGFNLTYKLLK